MKKIRNIKNQDAFMQFLGMMYACSMKTGTRSYKIITDSKYEELDDDLRTFIVAHEKGHIVRGHLNRKRDVEFTDAMSVIDFTIACRNVSDEIEADLYAAKIVGKETAVSSLRFVMVKTTDTITNNEFMNSSDKDKLIAYNVSEFKQRIAAVRAM